MHRIINRDGYAECYACGIVVDFTSDGDTQATFDALPCRPGGWKHPPYMFALPETDQGFGTTVIPDDLTPYFETCAAHPYGDCEAEARAIVPGRVAGSLEDEVNARLDAVADAVARAIVPRRVAG